MYSVSILIEIQSRIEIAKNACRNTDDWCDEELNSGAPDGFDYDDWISAGFFAAGMEFNKKDATIAKQAKELEAANKRVSELEKAGEDLFHGRIGGDSHWAITCGLRLAES